MLILYNFKKVINLKKNNKSTTTTNFKVNFVFYVMKIKIFNNFIK